LLSTSPPPQITASSTDPNAQAGYTDTADINVAWTMPNWTCPSGYTCHLEYCLTQSQPDGNGLLQGCGWQHPLPTAFTLQSGGTVYGSYRVVYDETATPSTAGSASIALNTARPRVRLNSPAGLTLNIPVNNTTTQPQFIDTSYGQYITYIAGDPAGESLTATIAGCAAMSEICDLLTPSPITVSTTAPLEWVWPASQGGDYAYIQVTATDQAGNVGVSPTPNPTNVFTEFTSGNLTALTCQPLTQNATSDVPCTELADQPPYEIPNDHPDAMDYYTACVEPGQYIAFSGYADPSMRGDPVVTTSNPYGTNLWMLYSYPKYEHIGTPCSNTGVVEVHLAQSSNASGPNGGASWEACDLADCGGDENAVAVWPSETFSNGCGIAGYSGTGTCWSSHEVSNFWPAANYPTTGSETWFAAHLMYFLQPGANASENISQYGCLVISTAANTPTALGWASGQGPSTCGEPTSPATLPPNNYLLFFQTLTDLSAYSPPQGTCYSSGEPAIMFGTAPDGSGENAVYLAASCFSEYFVSLGYYIFYTEDISGSVPFKNTEWQYWSGPFTYQALPLNSYSENPGQPVDSLTELDWAERADGAMVAVVTPAYVLGPGDTGTPFQYGCAVVNLNLLSQTNPFPSLVAVVNDADGSAGTWEQQGSNGCTYEPTSNTGVVIVRHKLDTSLTSPLNEDQYQTYAIIDTGIFP
jgi:hypothetical protein